MTQGPPTVVYNDRAAAKGTLAHPMSAQVHLSRDCCLVPRVTLTDYNALLCRCFQQMFSHSTLQDGGTSFVAIVTISFLFS